MFAVLTSCLGLVYPQIGEGGLDPGQICRKEVHHEVPQGRHAPGADWSQPWGGEAPQTISQTKTPPPELGHCRYGKTLWFIRAQIFLDQQDPLVCFEEKGIEAGLGCAFVCTFRAATFISFSTGGSHGGVSPVPGMPLGGKSFTLFFGGNFTSVGGHIKDGVTL